jgi:hypothetical protein
MQTQKSRKYGKISVVTMSLGRKHKRFFAYIQKTLTIMLVTFLAFYDVSPLFQWPPERPMLPKAEAAEEQAVRVESFDQDVTTDGSTFSLSNDVGAMNSAFIRMNTGTRKSSAGPTGSTGNTAPNIGTVGLVLTDTNEVTVNRADATEVKVMGEVWRYEGFAGGEHEFIVRDRVEVTFAGTQVTQAISGISNVDDVVPFITGYTVNDGSTSNWNAATIAVHINDVGELVVSRNNSDATATVYVDVVEFTGSAWTVCHGYSNSHDTAEQTITLNTDSDGQGGSTCDVGNWNTATIIQATMEGDTTETGLSDTLALVRPGGTTDSVVFDTKQDTNAANDGEAWIQVLQNDDMVVSRASNGDITEGDGTYDILPWPAGASTDAPIDTLALEWFSDTSGVGAAHMRGGLHARIREVAPTTYSDNDLVPDTDYDSTIQGNFEADITFAATPEGVVYEAGGTGTGSFVGYNDAGNFIIRAGNGASVAPSDAARIVITPGDYDFSSRSGELVWMFDPVTNSVSLSFDDGSNGSIDYATSTIAAAAWADWSGGDDGGVGTSNGSLAGSEITTAFDFNGTISEVRFMQGGGDGYEIGHWIHRSGNTVGVEYGVIELANLKYDSVFLGFDTLVTATSTQISEAEIPSSDIYIGGSFLLQEGSGTRNVTGITITESGSIDGANSISDVELWYDESTSAPYDCSEHSFNGNEIQFGSTDSNGFSGTDGVSSFTDTVEITTTKSLCVYPVLSISESASDGETIELSIADATTDVTVTGGGLTGSASYPQSISGATTLINGELTQTAYRWLVDDGVEGSATALDAENTPVIGFSTGNTRRLRLQVDAAGSTSSLPTNFQLDYATKTAACSMLTEWVAVDSSGADWNMSDSTFITDGNDSINISTLNGGVTDPVGSPTFVTPNGGLRDSSAQVGTLTLAADEFVEFEFAIEPSGSAPEGNTYCFRVSDAGSSLRNYDTFAEGTISADFEVAAVGNASTSIPFNTVNAYLGGAFSIVRPSGGSQSVTSITIAETGTINAEDNLSNVELWYDLDTSNPYDCSSESFNGDEVQFGSTDTNGFSGPNGTSTFTDAGVLIQNTSSFCAYVVADIGSGAANGETVNVEITNPSTDVLIGASSVGPSTAVSPTGDTAVVGAVLTQTHYHWRNDDGGETDATSASGGLEDTAIIDIPKETTYRVRLQVSNEGSVASAATNYRLEYGTKVSTCNNIVSWNDVGDLGGAWDMSLSANITDGNTSDIDSFVLGAMTEENAVFDGVGALRETTSESAAITLTDAEFTELEYSIEATEDAGFATDYCFRVTDSGTALPAYSQYAELTTREKQDFFIQRGSTDVSGTTTTLVAGVDYTAPFSTSTAFVRITNSGITGAGNTLGTTNQNSDDVTVFISDQSDITSSFSFERPLAAANTTRVDWEIIEFIGEPGTDNEMIVRDVGELAVLTPTATGSVVSNIADDNDVVVFVTGQLNDSASRSNYNDGLFTARWNATNSVPVLERGDADSSTDVSYAVVEFVGANWQVQRLEHVYSSAGVAETESMEVVPSASQVFVHAQKRVGNALQGLDEFGHQVWISSIGAVSFQLRSGANTPSDHVSVAWVISNSQPGDGAMRVYRSAGTIPADGPAATAVSLPIGQTVNETNASISANNDSNGAGTAFPRPLAAYKIASSTNYEIWRSETGQPIDYRVEVIEWPVAEISLRQNYYRFYVDNDALDPTDPWPVGAANLGENTSITGSDDPLGEGEIVRLRMTLQVRNATLPADLKTFKLQYGLQTTSCGAITTWNDLGDPGSGAIWRGSDRMSVDGTPLATSTPAPGTLNISVSDVAGTYEEQNNTATNPYSAGITDDIEFDWVIEHNGAAQRSNYCFRMVESDDTLLAGYTNYPVLRTTGYTPVVGDWRWYNDEENLTPSVALAAENTAPIEVANNELLKLRVIAKEVENAAGSNIKFALQYSEYADFSDGGTFVSPIGSCEENSLWCYADGAGIDNDPIDATVLSSTDACVSGVGVGCGTHNEAPTTTSSFNHIASSNAEFEFTLEQAGARANAVYYFRLYDVTSDEPLSASSSFPSLVTEGAQLVFSVNGLPSGTTTSGTTTDVATSPTAIDFGSVIFNTDMFAAQRLAVNTNATQGYQAFVFSDQQLINTYGDTIPSVAASNSTPTAWDTACSNVVTGCFGYHSTDATLAGGSARFAPLDSYAAITSTPEEVAFSSIPGVSTHDILYRIRVSELQPAGDYTTTVTYLVIPVF